MPRCLELTLPMFRCIVLTASLWLPGLFGMGYPAPAWSQTPGDMSQLRQDITAIRQDQDALRKEIEAIKQQLQARQPAAPPPSVQPIDAVVAIGDAPVKGNPNAKLTLIEFSDYQCRFCRRHAENTLPSIEKEYIATGKVRYVFHDFPLAIHPQAFKAAEAAHCAGEQQKYWEMHGRLFANQQALAPEKLSEQAQALGLEAAAFKDCLDSGRYAERVRKDIAEGQKLGIRGTPTLLLGVSEGNQVKEIKMLVGAQPFSVFKAEIDKSLAAMAATP